MSTPTTLKFLTKASRSLPNNDLFSAIRSRMLTKCYALLNTESQQPINEQCSACGINFSNILPAHKIEPTPKPNRFLRRQLQKQDQKTKYQFRSIKKYKLKCDTQKMVTICKSCNKQYTTTISKPKNILTSRQRKISEEQEKIDKLKLKRLQKKKDKFAGLKKSAVMAVQDLKKSATVICLDETDNSLNDSVIILDSPKNNSKSIACTPKHKNIIVIDNSPTPKPRSHIILPKREFQKLDNTTFLPQPKKIKLNNNANNMQNQKSQKNDNKNNVTNLPQNSKKTHLPQNSMKTNLPQNSTKSNIPQNKKFKKKKNKLLAQPIKVDKRSNHLKSLANILNKNNGKTTTSSMLENFLKSVQ